MKKYKINTNVSINELGEALKQKLPSKFNEKILGSAQLYVLQKDNAIEIGLPQPYEQYLYKIEVHGNEVSVSKSEHYTDDVNSLALEDILTDTVTDIVGKEHIEKIIPSV